MYATAENRLAGTEFFYVTRTTCSGIESAMRNLALPILALFLIATFAWADTPGTFRGVVIHGPEVTPGWIYLKSANGQVRRVALGRARVVYSDTVPATERQKTAVNSISTGTEVRVTAQQDKSGEWRATKIEILSLHGASTIEPSERSESLKST